MQLFTDVIENTLFTKSRVISVLELLIHESVYSVDQGQLTRLLSGHCPSYYSYCVLPATMIMSLSQLPWVLTVLFQLPWLLHSVLITIMVTALSEFLWLLLHCASHHGYCTLSQLPWLLYCSSLHDGYFVVPVSMAKTPSSCSYYSCVATWHFNWQCLCNWILSILPTWRWQNIHGGTHVYSYKNRLYTWLWIIIIS